MQKIILLLLLSVSAYSAESIFNDKLSEYSITIPFDDDDPSTKNIINDSYRIRSYINMTDKTTLKIMINRNADETLDLNMLYDATKNALRDQGLLIDPFKIPADESKLGRSFSALHGELHQITYLNKQNNNIINIVISGKDLSAVVSLNEWLRNKNK